MKVIKFVRFSLKMLRCRARELSYSIYSRPFFIKMRMRIELYKRVHKGLKIYEAILLKRLRLGDMKKPI